MRKEEVIEIVEKAFSGVKLDGGIGLWEAQAIDDYESKEVQKEKRLNDEKNNWASINSEVLQRCHSSLCFFDANGMRFHLPAFIIKSLGEKVADPVFNLTELDEYSKSQFITLNNEQIKAVVMYLQWCLGNEEFEFEHQSIKTAIEKYWQPKI